MLSGKRNGRKLTQTLAHTIIIRGPPAETKKKQRLSAPSPSRKTEVSWRKNLRKKLNIGPTIHQGHSGWSSDVAKPVNKKVIAGKGTGNSHLITLGNKGVTKRD